MSPGRAARPLVERLFDRVEITDTCWLWTGPTNPVNGYAQLSTDRRGGKVYIHRLAYESMVGPIPEGLVIDHLCRVRHCCNPDHLEAVTQAENVRRAPTGRTGEHNRIKTHCPQGHVYDAANTRLKRTGKHVRRTCRACEGRAA